MRKQFINHMLLSLLLSGSASVLCHAEEASQKSNMMCYGDICIDYNTVTKEGNYVAFVVHRYYDNGLAAYTIAVMCDQEKYATLGETIFDKEGKKLFKLTNSHYFWTASSGGTKAMIDYFCYGEPPQ